MNIQKKPNSIGIIGGAGPMALSLLYHDMIEYYQKNFKAKEDHDFPLISIVSYPFSPMVNLEESFHYHNNIIKELQHAADMLLVNSPHVLGIVCNTLHNYQECINIQSSAFISIIEATLKKLTYDNAHKALLLGTPTTIKNNLYSNNKKVEIAYPSIVNQKRITDIIYNILAGEYKDQDMQDLYEIIIQESKSHRINHVILGCTELPVLYRKFKEISILLEEQNIKIYDTIAILAESLIKAAQV